MGATLGFDPELPNFGLSVFSIRVRIILDFFFKKNELDKYRLLPIPN